MATTQPKTQEEILEEKLRALNQRLSVVEKLWTDGHTQVSVRGKMDEARGRVGVAEGVARYVMRGGHMVQSTDEVGALFEMTESLELWLQMGASEPESEMKRLLRRKVKLLTELGDVIHAKT